MEACRLSRNWAQVAELVHALVSGTSGESGFDLFLPLFRLPRRTRDISTQRDEKPVDQVRQVIAEISVNRLHYSGRGKGVTSNHRPFVKGGDEGI
jgi:hypothetical protein